jgi:hypothetical protein
MRPPHMGASAVLFGVSAIIAAISKSWEMMSPAGSTGASAADATASLADPRLGILGLAVMLSTLAAKLGRDAAAVKLPATPNICMASAMVRLVPSSPAAKIVAAGRFAMWTVTVRKVALRFSDGIDRDARGGPQWKSCRMSSLPLL